MKDTSTSNRNYWPGAIVMIVAALMDMLDVTIVNVALPTLHNRLHTSASTLEWIVSGYMLAFAAVLIITGRLGDYFGRRRLFLIGTFGFGLASLLSGLSANAEQLIIFRVLQGAMAATLMPQILATFRTVFSGKERASVFGLYGMVAGLGSAAGVILGGLLTQANLFGLSWRPIFLVNVPIALAMGLIALSVVPETKETNPGRLDLTGAVVLALALVAITWPLLEGQQHNWPVWYFLLIAAGLVVIGVLGKLERRRENKGVQPLLQAKQFLIPAFSAGILIQLLFSIGLQGFSLIFTLWLQLGHGFSPLHTGVMLLAFSLGAMFTAPFSGQWALRTGRVVLLVGAVLMAIGTAAIGALAMHGHFNAWPIAGALVVSGAGLGLLVVPLVNVVLAAVPSKTSGGASGLFNTAQQLGGALGVATIGSIFFAQLTIHHYDRAFWTAIIASAIAYILCAMLCVFLPQKAITDDEVIDI